MGKTTDIEWADSTQNYFFGCTKVSAGCDNCYAERILKDGFFFRKLNFQKKIEELESWKKPRRIFVNSMSDTFHERATDHDIDTLFQIFERYRHHTFIILTKRINRAYNYFKTGNVPDNCWIGTSIENKSALHRMVKLKMIKAKTRFISFEPLLEDLGQLDLQGIHWVIVGGESDYRNPRQMKEEWAMNIKLQADSLGIPFFFKQLGGSIKDTDGHWGTDKLYGQTYTSSPQIESGLVDIKTFKLDQFIELKQ
jgi:protein gp37